MKYLVWFLLLLMISERTFSLGDPSIIRNQGLITGTAERVNQFSPEGGFPPQDEPSHPTPEEILEKEYQEEREREDKAWKEKRTDYRYGETE
jgi:hypothetical protein